MDPERWNHVDRLLQSALDRPAGGARRVSAATPARGDGPLEHEVRSLLAAHDRAGSFSPLRRSSGGTRSSLDGATAIDARSAAIR